MFVRWFSGAILGTLIIAVTSPLFIRSYLPRELNRGVWTLPAGGTFRWRSEGYAATAVGPHGMPGKTSLDVANEDVRRVALWGDSQAEGVCVEDDHKIFAIAQSVSDQRLAVFPLAQSGDNVGHWITQIPWAETELGVTDHVFLIVELSDLIAHEPSNSPPSNATQWAAANLPAFVIAAIRKSVTTGNGQARTLRFRPGPVVSAATSPPEPLIEIDSMGVHLQTIRDAAKGSITIVYAPKLPSIHGNRIITQDDDDVAFERLRAMAAEHEIDVVDLRPMLIESGSAGQWPHGFQNGQIGVGHLNEHGNAIVAHAMVEHFR